MKTAVKLLVALAAVAGTVYVIATYGDKIVAWVRKMIPSCPCKSDTDVVCHEEDVADNAPAEVPAEEEAPAQEVPAEEAPVVEGNEPVAEDADFEA